MSNSRRLSAALLAATCSACLAIGASNPRPNVDLPRSTKVLALQLEPAVSDAFTIPSRAGIRSAEVTGWRQTLQAGFTNAFGSSYAPAGKGGKADLTLVIIEADPALVAASYRGSSATAVGCQLRYKAHLLDGTGQELGRSAATVESKTTTGDIGALSEIAGSAVETFYERVSADLFRAAPPAAK